MDFATAEHKLWPITQPPRHAHVFTQNAHYIWLDTSQYRNGTFILSNKSQFYVVRRKSLQKRPAHQIVISTTCFKLHRAPETLGAWGREGAGGRRATEVYGWMCADAGYRPALCGPPSRSGFMYRVGCLTGCEVSVSSFPNGGPAQHPSVRPGPKVVV